MRAKFSLSKRLLRRTSNAIKRARRPRLSELPSPPAPGNDSKKWSQRRLNWLVTLFDGPVRYLEIGVSRGSTLVSVHADEIIGVDPVPRFNPRGLPAHIKFERRTSNSFFRRAWGIPAFDLVFLDGLHTADQTWTDLWNTLRRSHFRTIILVDDVVPDSDITAIPNQRKAAKLGREAGFTTARWHGDVWKMLPTLSQVLPTINFQVIGASGKDPVKGEDNLQALMWWGHFDAVSKHQLTSGLGYIRALQDVTFSEFRKGNQSIFAMLDERDAFSVVARDFSRPE